MDAPAKGLLKVSSILFIVFAAISVVVSIVGLIGVAALAALGASYDTTGAVAVAGGVAIFAMIIAIVSSLIQLVVGILGVKKSGDATKAQFFIVTGFIIGGLQLISIVISFNFLGLIGLVLPILYIVGGFQNKKAASTVSYQA